MGVIRRDSEPRPIRVEDCEEFNYANYDLTESDSESLQSVNVKVVAAASRSQRKKECRESRRLRRFHDNLETGGVNLRKNMGARKWRRVENARFLLSMVDKEDVVDDFSDIVERQITAFDELLSDTAKMAVWNDFIERDEEEQERLLEEARCITKKEKAGEPGSWFVVGGSTPVRGKGAPRKEDGGEGGAGDAADRRNHHPAYSASSCFARLNPKLRGFLSEKSLPWALLDRADRELRGFFTTIQEGKWRRCLRNPRERLALHAVAAFLMLSSRTLREEKGEVVEIRNARAYFIPPHTNLIPYLATRRKAPIEFAPEPRWADDRVSDDEEEETNGGAEASGTSDLDASFEIV